MALTPAQLQTLKAAINGNPTWAAFPQNSDGYFALAQVLNVTASPAFSVWRTEVPVSTVIDSINLANYTPNTNIASGDTDPTISRLIGWALYCQTKQMNLQLMLQGRDRMDCSKATVRANLRDAVIQVPSGASGALTSPGGASGATTLGVCVRNATEAEKILVGAVNQQTGTVTAAVLGFEGNLSPADVQAARELP